MNDRTPTHYPSDSAAIQHWIDGGRVLCRHCGARMMTAPADAGAWDDAAALDRLAYLLSAPEWPGASGMEDVAAIVGRVRDVTTPRGAVWDRH